jgi:hypothetical protein
MRRAMVSQRGKWKASAGVEAGALQVCDADRHASFGVEGQVFKAELVVKGTNLLV